MFGIDTAPTLLDQQIRVRLAESLEHIFERRGDELELEDSRIGQILQTIQARRVDPGVFARYFELVFSLQDDDYGRARGLTNELAELADREMEFRILPYTRSELGDDFERFPRLVFASFSDENPMVPPGEELFESHRAKLQEAIKIVEEQDPEIASEISGLISRIIVAKSKPDSEGSRSFGGVSSLMAWGAVFLNANSYVSIPQLVTFLVHEITHSVLFGYDYGTSMGLVRNHPEDGFTSPLRTDPRPMDGIFHATLVCARVALFVKSWLDEDRIDDEDLEWANRVWEGNSQLFREGLGTIKEHGELADQGWAMLNAADSQILARTG